MKQSKLALAVLFLALTGCGPSEQAKTPEEQTGSNPFKLSGDVKHIMQWVLDPAADGVWDSAGSIITAAGTKELAPTTDEGWMAVEHSAAVVAASGNLLLMPGRAVDDEGWQNIAQGLVEAGLLAQAAAKNQDSDALFDAGGQIYRVCKACHSVYIQDEEATDTL
ncbi:MAG: hypothetical protein KBT88_12250 [Gammaproteobacteria bacterium]|nr:hypothetical protein [Gammaproteobacteria bacterium]MBQ0840547.1 hypothetical protein [Gammaproteobacteria bacterium]